MESESQIDNNKQGLMITTDFTANERRGARFKSEPQIELKMTDDAANAVEEYLANPSGFKLRDHQKDGLRDFAKHLRQGHKQGYMDMPTGSGKTAVASVMAGIFLDKFPRQKVIVISPYTTILEQNASELQEIVGADVRAYYGKVKHRISDGQIINTTYRSLLALLESKMIKPEEISLVLLDEIHSNQGDEFRKALELITRSSSSPIMVGLTATPFFIKVQKDLLDNKIDHSATWLDIFFKQIHSLTLEECMGYILAPARVFEIRTGVKIKPEMLVGVGDYDTGEKEKTLEALGPSVRNHIAVSILAGLNAKSSQSGLEIGSQLNLPSLQIDEIAKLHELLKTRKTAVFGISVAHIIYLQKLLDEYGIKSEILYGAQSLEDQDKPLSNYEDPEGPRVILGVQKLSMGWNSPQTKGMIILDPTRSPAEALQRFGRGLRIFKDPVTGKLDTKAQLIAIELYDDWRLASLTRRPILIPELFDLSAINYKVIQPTKEVKTTRDRNNTGSNKRSEHSSPLQLEGVDIELSMSEVELSNFWKVDFRNTDIATLVKYLDKQMRYIETIQGEKFDLIGIYKEFALLLPEKIPLGIVNTLIEEINKENDEERLGTLAKSLVLLNLKSILSGLDTILINYPEIAEDILQDVLTLAIYTIKKKKLIDKNKNLSTILYKFAIYTAQKSRKFHINGVPINLSDLPPIIQYITNPSNKDNKDILGALQTLNAIERKILNLRYFGKSQLTVNQISQKLGYDKVYVNQIIRTSLKKLKEQILGKQ